MRPTIIAIATILTLASPIPAHAIGSASCESLKSVSLAHLTVTTAETVAAGPYAAPAPAGGGVGRGGRGADPPAPVMLPSRCRVAAVLAPSADSHIEMELWLPTDNWNGKFQAVGNGGWAGVISYGALAAALRDGYAAASTDTGHKGGTGEFAQGHPEKLVDFGYRAVHEMTAASKALIAAFYGGASKFSYFNGCSTGGRQALMEAQRYPEDFDAIIAGAPANNHIHLHTASLARAIDLRKDPEGAVPADKLSGLAAAVIKACDALDGVKDGIVSNPRACHFDPSSLLCHGADTASCLTPAQVQSVKRMYSPTTLKSGEVAWSGDEFGSESGWAPIGGASSSPPGGIALDTMRYLGHQDPNWDWRTFDLDRDTALADKNAGFINSIDPNLRAFKAHGGKLLLYHGWADATIAPGHTIDYYSSVRSTMGSGEGDWVRLFLAPGMQHCGGGPGPNQANFIGALERWRESGTAPDRILASHVSGGRVDMTRPLCPYPQTAVYSGVGSTNDAANFVCK